MQQWEKKEKGELEKGQCCPSELSLGTSWLPGGQQGKQEEKSASRRAAGPSVPWQGCGVGWNAEGGLGTCLGPEIITEGYGQPLWPGRVMEDRCQC